MDCINPSVHDASAGGGVREMILCGLPTKKNPLTRCKMGRGSGVLLDEKNNGILRG